MSRNSKGSLVVWFLLLALIGLVVIVGVISLEFLIRWVSLARIQNAAQEASLVYARDLVRLRDNRLSMVAPGQTVNFASAGLPTSCSLSSDGGGSPAGCTPLTGEKASIPGASNLENLNASQVLLYNVWGRRIKDASEVTDVRQRQCYKTHDASRFSLNTGSPLNNCDVTGTVTSPIMSLRWSFQASPYGTGVCCSAGGGGNKDFCVVVNVKGRMDPIMAGGLPFLQDIDFIRVGDFNISSRVAVKKMNSEIGSTVDSMEVAKNLSGETISIEPNSSATCPAAPPYTPPVTPYTPPVNPPPLIDPPPPDPPDDPPPGPSPTNPPPCTVPPISCPPNFSPSVISQGACDITYTCVPPTPPGPPPPPPSCAAMYAYINNSNDQVYSGSSGNGSIDNLLKSVPAGTDPKDHVRHTFNSSGCNSGQTQARGTCFRDGSQYGGEYDGSCYCPIVLSFDGNTVEVSQDKGVSFAFDGKTKVKSYWLKHSSKIGFLAYDFNLNGRIDDGRELFGQYTNGKRYKNGYLALADLRDSDRDGVLKGAELNKLVLWQDHNHDGSSSRNEVKALSDFGVVEIRLNNLHQKPINLAGGSLLPYSKEGLVVKTAKGLQIGSTYDLWLAPYIELSHMPSYLNP